MQQKQSHRRALGSCHFCSIEIARPRARGKRASNIFEPAGEDIVMANLGRVLGLFAAALEPRDVGLFTEPGQVRSSKIVGRAASHHLPKDARLKMMVHPTLGKINSNLGSCVELATWSEGRQAGLVSPVVGGGFVGTTGAGCVARI